MTGHIRVGGTWQDVDSIYARVGGAWKDVTDGWTKVGGTWKQFYTAGGGSTIETPLGTPDYTYSQGDTTFGAGQVQALFAIDVNAFATSTEGLLFEQGATVLGMGAYMVGDGTLRVSAGDGSPWQNADASYIDVDISSLAGASGTFYFYADLAVTENKLKVFWLEGGPSSGNNPILIGDGQLFSGVPTGIFGAAAGAIGIYGGSTVVFDFGIASPINYAGTITQARIWLNQNLPTGFSAPDWMPLVAEYVVVAGGGSGGDGEAGGAGGGGAGGYRSSVTGESSGGGASAESALSLAVSTNYSITVGAGGAESSSGQGNDGSNSVFHTITSTGGGGGGSGREASATSPGRSGGSGGGAGSDLGVTYSGGAGTTNQGFAGGVNQSNNGAGGGGGAGQVGFDGTTTTGGAGGDGVQTSIDGTPTYYGGGGGGGTDEATGSTSSGGLGGGGNGNIDSATQTSTEGSPNTGGGGGGGGASGGSGSLGRAGGSGIVIIRYPSGYSISLTGLTGTTSSFAGMQIAKITAGTGTVSWS